MRLPKEIRKKLLQPLNGLSAGLGVQSIFGIVLSYTKNKTYLIPWFLCLGMACMITFTFTLWMERKK